MTDEIANSIPAPVASPEVVSVEATTAPASPAVETPTVETPNVDTPLAPETVNSPAEAAPAEVVAPETLLGGEKKTEEAPAEAKPDGEKPETEGETKPEEKPAEEVALPEFEAFALPEGVELEADKLSEFTKELAEFENTTKASHEEVQKLGQKMVDKYIAEQKRFVEHLTNSWEKQKTDWKDSFLKDPEFTNRTNTVVNAAIDAIGIYGGDAKQQNEFRDLMETTGVGNHPAMIRLLSNIMLAKAEPKPLAAPLIASGAKTSKIQKMYGTKK